MISRLCWSAWVGAETVPDLPGPGWGCLFSAIPKAWSLADVWENSRKGSYVSSARQEGVTVTQGGGSAPLGAKMKKGQISLASVYTTCDKSLKTLLSPLLGQGAPGVLFNGYTCTVVSDQPLLTTKP